MKYAKSPSCIFTTESEHPCSAHPHQYLFFLSSFRNRGLATQVLTTFILAKKKLARRGCFVEASYQTTVATHASQQKILRYHDPSSISTSRCYYSYSFTRQHNTTFLETFYRTPNTHYSNTNI